MGRKVCEKHFNIFQVLKWITSMKQSRKSPKSYFVHVLHHSERSFIFLFPFLNWWKRFLFYFSLNCKEILLKIEDFLSFMFLPILNRNHHLELKICFVSFSKTNPHSNNHQFPPLSCLHFSTVACFLFYFILLLFVKVTVSISVTFKINIWPYVPNCIGFFSFYIFIK